MRQEGISKASARRSATCQAGNVIDCEVGWNTGFRLVLFAKPVEPVIGNDDSGLLGIDGGIGKVLVAKLERCATEEGRGGGKRLLTAGLPKLLLVMA